MPGYDIHRFSPSLVRSLSEHSLVSLSAGANATTGPKSGPRCKRRYVLVRVADDDLVTKPLEVRTQPRRLDGTRPFRFIPAPGVLSSPDQPLVVRPWGVPCLAQIQLPLEFLTSQLCAVCGTPIELLYPTEEY